LRKAELEVVGRILKKVGVILMCPECGELFWAIEPKDYMGRPCRKCQHGIKKIKAMA